jgi:hypothetical protein
VTREGWGYTLSRWPLLGSLFVMIALEFLAYVWVRQMVNLMEWAWTCACSKSSIAVQSLCFETYLTSVARTGRGQRRKLRARLRSAPNYEAWKQSALELDERGSRVLIFLRACS